MTIFNNGCLRPGHISTYFLRGRFHQIGPVSSVGQMVSINVMGASHNRLPFHWISQWTGSFFEESCLVKTRLVIWLGHYGNPCPWDDDLGEAVFFAHGGPEDTHDLDTDSELDEEPTGARFIKEAHDLPTGVLFIRNSKTITTIVDKSRVHTHIVKYCTCPEAAATDIQLFEMGLFPASFLEPKTAFTFDALREFLLDNLECGTSAMNYYSKLRRMITSVFPHLVSDHYRELMRVVRQWRKLNLMRWNGFGHQDKQATPSDLALFCPACPQPGINVSLPTGDTMECNECDMETPSWLYSRSLVMDGNFKGEHLHFANPSDEVSLMDGCGYMIGSHRHRQVHLRKAQLFCSTCNGGFSEGRKYHKHLKERIANSPILQLNKELDIIPGIGLWHASSSAGNTSKLSRGLLGANLLLRSLTRLPIMINIHVVTVLMRKQQELQLLTVQGQWAGPAHWRSVATWLAEGLTIEEAQPDIYHWVEAGSIFLGNALGNNEIQIMELELVILQDDSDNEMQEELRVFEPEKVAIPLPSNLGLERCISLGVANLVEQELTLREGQAVMN
ncbi:hypothetical protein F4604DRAFT_1688189 [Suillus subluteus]|nr:hypothetical protein F4604DRAFT_1688189 [Suillus subluteus]